MLRIVPHTVPCVGRSYEHFPDGFELHLLQEMDDEEDQSGEFGDESGGLRTRPPMEGALITSPNIA